MESEAAVQVIESIGDLIEASKDEAEKLIEAEFAGIFAQLESRETALIKRAKAISASKTSALRCGRGCDTERPARGRGRASGAAAARALVTVHWL